MISWLRQRHDISNRNEVKQMNKGGFSWKRFFGVSKVKYKIAKTTGIPTTKQGRKRKIQNIFWKMFFKK